MYTYEKLFNEAPSQEKLDELCKKFITVAKPIDYDDDYRHKEAVLEKQEWYREKEDNTND